MRTIKRISTLGLVMALIGMGTLLSHHTLAQPSPADIAAGPKMTKTQAIQAARDYCAKIGQPVTTPGQAAFPLTTAELDGYWLPRWLVTFPSQAELDVADANGIVTYYTNKAYFQREGNDPTPSGPAIPEAEAMRRAQQAVDATGQHEELQTPTATEEQPRPERMFASYHHWQVDWPRTFHGIPYMDQGADVLMDAQTGEVMVMHLTYPTPPLTQAVTDVTPEQAVGLAAAHLAFDLGVQYPARLRDAAPFLQAVRPNGGWSRFQDAPGQSRTARVAWVVRYLFHSRYFGREEDIWVDAQTGEILGGKSGSGSFGASTAGTAPAQAAPPLAQTLPAVRAVYVGTRDAKAKVGWAIAPKLTTQDEARACAALKSGGKPLKAGPTGEASYQIALLDRDNRLAVYSYFPDTGALGGGADWVSVPKSFKAWMQTRIGATAKKP